MPDIKESKDPVDWISEHLSVETVEGSELFIVKFQGSDPVDAAMILNAIVWTARAAVPEVGVQSTLDDPMRVSRN